MTAETAVEQQPQEASGEAAIAARARDNNGRFVAEAKAAAKEHDARKAQGMSFLRDAFGVVDEPAAPEAQEENTKAAQAAEGAGASAPEQPATEREDQELQKALRVLSFRKLPDSAVKAMSRDEIISLAEHDSKASADWHREHGKNGKEKAQADEGDQPAEPARPTVDIAALSRPVAELLDPDAAPVVEQAFQGVVDAVTRHFNKEIEALRAANLRAEERSARQHLQESFPQVRDDEKWTPVVAKARTLLKTGDYDGLESALADAVKMVHGQPPQRTSSATAQKRANGTPMVDSRTTSHAKGLSGRALNEAIAYRLLMGDTAGAESLKKG